MWMAIIIPIRTSATHVTLASEARNNAAGTANIGNIGGKGDKVTTPPVRG